MFEGITAFFVSVANTILLVIAITVFFGIMAGVYYMNKQERECDDE